MGPESKHHVMSRSFDNLPYRILLMSFMAFHAMEFHGQDAASSLMPARMGSGQAIWAAGGGLANRSNSPAMLFDLVHQQVNQGVGEDGFQTSRLQLSWHFPEKHGNPGEATGILCLIEDDKEGTALQRFRLLAGGFKRIQINRSDFLTGAIQLGFGQRIWKNQGVWDSQYLLNPVQPLTEESGEALFQDRATHFEVGGELTYQAKNWTAAYRLLHAPVNQGFFRHSKDAYAIRHTVLASWYSDFKWQNTLFRSLCWTEIERQGTAMLWSTGAMLEREFGEDSRFTDNRSSTIVALGLVYRNTGQLAPIMSIRFQRRWTCWVAPEWSIGAQSINSGWSAGIRGQLSL